MSNQIRCPVCNCADVSIIDILDYDFDGILYKVECGECGKRFEVQNTIVCYTIQYKKD